MFVGILLAAANIFLMGAAICKGGKGSSRASLVQM
jgi:hypothetical protein